jgi:hypothetical protein
MINNHTIERWRDVPGYEKLYQVSDMGRVRSLGADKNHKGKILKGRIVNKYGHLSVQLCKKCKARSFLIHRLVLLAFVGPCPDGMECRHLDGNHQNNKLKNLKWGTSSENRRDAMKHGTWRPVKGPDNSGSKHGLSKFNEKIIKKSEHYIGIINLLNKN